MTQSERLAQLALHGGAKLRTEPFPERGLIGLEEKAAVDAVFDRSIATGVAPMYGGAEEEAYCQEFAEYMGGGYVDAVSSGTAALYVALRALNPEPFSEAIVGAITDPGGMMPIPLSNLIPIIADTIPGGFNTGPEQVAELISPLTVAIVVPHIAGEPADVEGIVEVARKRGIAVIEDCSQAHDARLNGKLVGSFGDMAIFSTMSGKHHSSGGQGGLVYTKDEALYQATRRGSDRGKPFFLSQGSTNVIASLNLNMNDIASAIGRVQLRKLPQMVQRRRSIVARIRQGVADLETVSLPTPLEGAEPSYWFLRMIFHTERATCDKDTFCQALSAEGLSIQADYRGGLPHSHDWFVQRRVFGDSGYPWVSPDYDGDPNREFPCPNANAALDAQFNLQFHENWGEREVADLIAIFRKVNEAYRRS